MHFQASGLARIKRRVLHAKNLVPEPLRRGRGLAEARAGVAADEDDVLRAGLVSREADVRRRERILPVFGITYSPSRTPRLDARAATPGR